MDLDIDINLLKSKISSAQNDVKLNLSNYDGHVELISLLSNLYCVYKSEEPKYDADSEQRKTASEQTSISFKKLRHARQTMSTVYPLSVELWIKWIEDEMNAPPHLFDNEIMEDIFKRATVDYLSADIWCYYVSYLIRQLENGSTTPDLIRATLEKAVTNCGLHYQDGYKIWKCYIDFELKFLSDLAKMIEENVNESNLTQFKIQLLKVVKVYKRVLRLPLAQLSEMLTNFRDSVVPYVKLLQTFPSYNEFFINIGEFENIYHKTNDSMREIAVNETLLVEENHSFERYHSYISEELKAGSKDPARIQCLFERAIVYHCLKPTLWLDYMDFLNNVIKLPELVTQICKRALRNITWDSRIDIKYATILEELSFSENEIRIVYKDGLQKYSRSGYNYCNLFISYLSFEKRTFTSPSVIMKRKSKIYELIQQAVYTFDQMEDADKSIGEFVLFWIDVERFWFNNGSKAKDIWKYMLAKYKSLWCQAMTFARSTGDFTYVDDIFSTAVLQYPDDAEMFCQTMLNYGAVSYESFRVFISLMKKTNHYMSSRIQSLPLKESSNYYSVIEHKSKSLKWWFRKAEDTLFSVESDMSVLELSGKKSKRPHEASERHEHRNHVDTPVIGPVLPTEVKASEKQTKNHVDAPIIGPVLPPNLNSQSVESSSDSEASNEEEETEPRPKKLKIADDTHEEGISSTEVNLSNTTVFVSNLHPATKETDLRIIFSRAGEVQKVDLRKQKGGKIFAFVTYSTYEEARKAFDLEHTPLLNRPIFVSEFKYTKHTENVTDSSISSSKYSQEQERNKLYVSNLHKATTQIDLEKLFNQYGDMSSLRLINKKGTGKSFAYVEYATEEAASRYRKAVNNSILRGQAIRVEFSNPSVVGSRSNISRPFSYEGNSRNFPNEDRNKNRAETSNIVVQKDSSDDTTFVKPKPVKLGMVPFQARNMKKQPLNTQSVTKKGPMVRINFVPSSSSKPKTESTSEETSNEGASNAEQSSAAAVSSARKSNEEFRKMFFKS